MTWIAEHYIEILAAIGALYSVARIIVTLTPTPKDDAALDRAWGGLRALAAVFGLDLKAGVSSEPKRPPSKLPSILLVGALSFAAVAATATQTGCVALREDPGAQFQAASLSYVAAVDAAIELRRAGKLTPEQIDAVGVAVHQGRAILEAWGAAIKAGEDYPSGAAALGVAVGTIRDVLALHAGEEE